MTKMKSRFSDERGIAIITALLISLVIVTLGTTSVSIAIHNSESSSFDRRRVTGIAAAEAGIDYYFSHLQSATVSTGMACEIGQPLNTTPVTRFDAEVTFYDAAGNEMDCPPATDPATALIRSEGQTTANTTPTRTMEAYVRLTPRPSNPFGTTAIFSNSSINWPANVKIEGADASNSNIYSNGNVNLSSASIIYGSVYAQGSITLNGNAQVRRDAWARTSVTLNSSSSVLGDGIASEQFVRLNNNGKIYQDATACTTISAKSKAIGGVSTTGFCPPAQTSPPRQDLPVITFDPNPWVEQGYTVQTFTGTSACTTAKNFIRNSITGGSYAIRIAHDCTLSWNRDVPLIRGNLAIISDGGMSVGKQTKWNASGGPWNLHFFFGIDNDGQPCNITWDTGSGIGANLHSLQYTPCTISLGSNVHLNEGQLFGGTVTMRSNSGIRYRQMPVPGSGNEAYDEDVLYVREVVTGSETT